MKQMVYKFVAERSDGALVSAYVWGKAEKVYVPGVNHRAAKWLADKGYHNTAFRNRKTAIAFRLSSSYMQLWKAEATGVIPRKKLPPICQPGPLNAGVLTPVLIDAIGEWPNGTVMCKTIKLLERVEV